jgi:hypothetical protein
LSSKKKNTKPTNKVMNNWWGDAPDSKASGSKCMKAVASRAPAAKLSKCWV